MSTTIPPNNNTGLYNTTGTPIPVDNNILANNISATGNVTVGGYILANGSITTESNFVGDLLGNVSATGSVVANAVYTNNYLYANGQPFSGGGSGTYGNANVAAYLPTYGGTVLANLINFTNNSGVIEQGDQRITITGNATGVNTGAYFNDTGEADIFANSYVAIATNTTGNINPTWTFDQLGNLSAPGNITAVGNIAGGYILGNGSQLTGLPATYTDANVNTHLANFGSNVISTTGNITAGYFFGDGSQLTGLPATYGNANVAAYLPTYSGNLNPNTISATGNITGLNLKTSGAFGNITGANYVSASYFVGDGSLLTNLPSGNATLSGNLAGNLSGNGFGADAFSFVSAVGNVTGGNLVTAGGVYVTGVVSAVGNVRGGNINTNGIVSATGNITGSYIFGNGSQLTGLPATYGNSNVTTLLAAFGSNTISTTGNINSGNIIATNIGNVAALNLNGNASQVLYGNGVFAAVAGGGSYGNSNVNTLLSAWGANTLSTTGTITGGNITGGNVLTGGIVSAVGNITAPYFIGNGSALTGITATASAGGANTQLQYNNGGALAGNSLMTFDQTTGNISLANLVVSAAPNAVVILNSQATNLATQTSTVAMTGRNVFGIPLGGSVTPGNIDLNTILKGSKYAFTDNITYSTAGTVYQNIGSLPYVTLAANITNTSSQIQSFRAQMVIGGGAGANTISTTSSTAGPAGAIMSVTIGGGGQGYSAVGNTSVSHARGAGSSITINSGSNVGNALVYTVAATVTPTNGANTLIGIPMSFGGTGNVVSGGNLYGVYMANNTATFGFSSSNTMRAATNYYFLYNNDDVAQNKIGSLRSYTEYQYTSATTSGSIIVDKLNGQTQYFPVSGSLTISGFANFSVAPSNGTAFVYQRDTVTIIFRQPATGQTITLPTGAGYKYAGGNSTMGTTANAVQIITVQGVFNTTTVANEYLITVSPEFV